MQNSFRIIFLIFLFPVFFTACTDEESELGLNLQDPNSLLYTADTTLRATAYTFLHDSLKTSSVGTHLLGFYKDQTFGQVSASIFSQISLQDSKGFELQGAYTLDSLVLTMVFSGIYPANQNSKSLHIQVYQLSEDMSTDATYYATSTVAYGSTPLFDGNVTFNSTDSVKMGGINYPPQIRMRLSNDFMNKIGTRKFDSNEDFIKFVKGLYIKVVPDGSAGTVGYFNLASTYSGMSLYYKASGGEATVYNFIFDSKSAHFEHIEHNYAGTALSTFNSNRKDSIDGSSKLYLEALGGTYFKFYLPDLAALKNQRYSINHATLVIPVSSETPDSDPPQTIVCLMNTSTGGTSSILDMTSDGSVVSISYDASRKQYRIPLARYVQNILNGHNNDFGVNVYVTAATTTANRVVLNGTNVSDPVRLEIIFTK